LASARPNTGATFVRSEKGYELAANYGVNIKAAIDFDERLAALSARRLVPLAKGDEQADDGYASALEPWIRSVFDELGVVCRVALGDCKIAGLTDTSAASNHAALSDHPLT